MPILNKFLLISFLVLSCNSAQNIDSEIHNYVEKNYDSNKKILIIYGEGCIPCIYQRIINLKEKSDIVLLTDSIDILPHDSKIIVDKTSKLKTILQKYYMDSFYKYNF